MKILKFSTLSLLYTLSLQSTTLYYNGENNDIGEWFIQDGSGETASITQVYDDTLNSNVMRFSEAGVYRLRLAEGKFWQNTTETILSFDVNMDSYYTIFVYVDTPHGVRKLFFNALNTNAGHHNNAHLEHVGDSGTGIISSFGRHRTHRDNRDHRRGWLNNPLDNNNRNGWVRATIDLERMLVDIEPDNHITSILSVRIAGSSGMIDNVTLDNPTMNSKGTQVDNWHLSTGITEGGTIELINDGEPQNSVIKFNGLENSNSFTTGAKEGVESWNDTQNDSIQWKIKTENWFKVIVHINTTNGLRDMVYFPERPDQRLNLETAEIGIGIGNRRHLGDASPDTNDDGVPDYDIGTGGTWQTFTRNLAMDVAEYENGNELVAINGVSFIGTNSALHNSAMVESSMIIDDLQLFGSVIPTVNRNVNDEIATDLHSWRLRENSVRISFVDNAIGESGFRYIDAETNLQVGDILPATEGMSSASIATINGLIAGTTYNIRVETLFDDGRSSTISEPITFTTLGNPPQEQGEEATELHRWRLREHSVRISFVDNAEGESEFRYVNVDTGLQIGDIIPATEGTGTSNIGTINGLTAGTTYNIRVETLFDDGRDTAMSEPLTFTTLGNPPRNDRATELHRWRLREDSVRISFRDNSEGESGFRYVDMDTGLQVGDIVPATEGTGTSNIGTINGLTAGTTYNIRVETLFNDGRTTANSEPLTFTTLGNPPIQLPPVDNLHTWSLRSVSVKISFQDQSEGESGFRFINEATGEQMRDDLPATEGLGSSSIGRINGLEPNTTYRVRVQTLGENGVVAGTSEAIEFTTLVEE